MAMTYKRLGYEIQMKDMKRAVRRKRSVHMAERKMRKDLSRHITLTVDGRVVPLHWYDNLHQYSKNKIHCSCPLCRPSGEKASDLRKKGRLSSGIQEYLSVEIEEVAV